eukprot:3314129-Rhodomonas_salina.2
MVHRDRQKTQSEKPVLQPVRRIVVSRDGRFQKSEILACRRVAQNFNCTVDMVEVPKSGPDVPRMIQIRMCSGGSKHEIAGPKPGNWWPLSSTSAVLATSVYSKKVGLVQTIGIKLVESIGGSGPTPLHQVVKEQYWLTQLKVYSTHTTRLPIHIHLADRSAGDRNDGVEYPPIEGHHAA